MMTFNNTPVDPDKLHLDGEGDTEESRKYYHLGLLTYRYPESWLPLSFDHYFSCAQPGQFEVVKVVDGREHYIWTMKSWRKGFWKITPLRKWLIVLRLIIKTYFNTDFKYWAKAFWKSSNQKCFEEGWMGHEFWFVEKK